MSWAVKLVVAILFACSYSPRFALAAAPMPQVGATAKVEQWGVFELSLTGPAEGNPFAEVELHAEFVSEQFRVRVRGFYDGGGTYRIRFMPPRTGSWRYVTASNVPALHDQRGVFTAHNPSGANRGPVRVDGTHHFAHASGAPYYPVGTTIYALVHQPEVLQQQTLSTLAASPFNKVRFCVLPKWYSYNRTEPVVPPFVRRPDGRFDVFRPNPAFYARLERRIEDLQKLNIEVDLILFHPYDEGHWGFDRMGRDADQQYLRYVLARLGAYRNVWWSMANEWDLDKNKTVADWNQLFDIVEKEDPYGKLCSIHQANTHFDHARRPITHVSVQNIDGGIVGELRAKYGKPAINDECEYEGDIESPWGNISGQELVHRMWQGTIRGGYVGHGETFFNKEEVLWWSKGGVLKGESPPRIAFLRKMLEEQGRVEPVPLRGWQPYPVAQQGESFLVYLGRHAPRSFGSHTTRTLEEAFPRLGKSSWHFEIIDPWEMTVTAVPGTFSGSKYQLVLPGKMFMALRATSSVPSQSSAPPRHRRAPAP